MDISMDISISTATLLIKLNITDKTQLLWAGSNYGPALLGRRGPLLQLGEETIAASDDVRLLGVTISSELRSEKHVSITSSACFWLR